MLGHEPRNGRISDLGAGRHAIERDDDVKHGPMLELTCFPLRLLPHIVRGGPGVEDRVMPQPAVVRAAIVEADHGPHPVGEADLGDSGARRRNTLPAKCSSASQCGMPH